MTGAAARLVALVIAAVLLALPACRRRAEEPPAAPEPVTVERPAPGEPGEPQPEPGAVPAEGTAGEETVAQEATNGDSVSLYFPGGSRLYREEREMSLTGDTHAKVRALVEALLVGPRVAGLRRPMTEGVQLVGIYLSGDGTAYVDLSGPRESMGSKDELLSVYSLVNSVALNVPEVQSVVLLWDGSQLATLAGHVYTGQPLRPRRDL